jgi:UDP-GlcNAc:undecaprenyl-phosphate GlcNAc-1-phosphate transferase
MLGTLGAPFGIALAVALGATLGCEWLGRRMGMVRPPRADRWHRRPVPALGGTAIVAGVVAGVGSIGVDASRFGGFLLMALGIALVGLADDLRPMRPLVKLLPQIVLAGLLVQLGFMLRLTAYPALNVLLTLFWVVGITNALNLLDNMDGLAAGVAAIAGAFRLVFFLFDGDLVGAAVMAALIGAVLGFLLRNFPPAKIFMGDAGSLFLGFFLGGVCLVGDFPYSRGVSAVLVFPVLLMLIPIFDTTFVTVTRILGSRPVSRGGRDHTSHRLVSLGISEGRALALLYGISIVSGLLALVSYRHGFAYTAVLVVLLAVGLVLLAVHLGRTGPPADDAGVAVVPVISGLAGVPVLRPLAKVMLDVVLVVVAYYSAYLLRFEEDLGAHREVFVRTVAPVLVLQIASLAGVGAYRGLWRYTSLVDVVRLGWAVTIGTGASVLLFVFTQRFAGLSRAVFVLDWVLLLVLLGASRLSFRLFAEMLRRRPGEDFRPVLIYGAGDGGALTVRELVNNPALRRRAVGFVDDDPEKLGTRIQEVPVLGNLDALDRLVARHRVTEVIVSSTRIPAERLRQLRARCEALGIRVVRASVRFE